MYRRFMTMVTPQDPEHGLPRHFVHNKPVLGGEQATALMEFSKEKSHKPFANRVLWLLPTAMLLILIVGCSRGPSATRTPVPTWTPTPSTGAVNVDSQPQSQAADAGGSSLAVQAVPADSAQPANAAAVPVEGGENAAAPAQVEQVPPTPVPAAQPTETPEALPTEEPTATPEPLPTETPTPSGPQYDFELETAEKFPTDSLAENVVRIFLYVYSGGEFALPGYSLVVAHDEATLPVDAVSTGGLPEVTRDEPGIYTRFTNMNAIFIEPQGGTWAIQLVDDLGVAVGPPAFIELAPDDASRELYLRYRKK